MIAALLASAASLYAFHCASCHGLNGQGTADGPPLVGVPSVAVHFMLDTGRMPAVVPYENELHQRAAFSSREIDQIVTYVTSFSLHANRASPRPGPGDPVRGRALYAENCMPCHGAGGSGGSVGYDNVAPSLADATALEVAEATRTGPGMMPRFGPDVLSAQDVRDIARYIRYLQTQVGDPNARYAGGVALGFVGPVAEGFIAWLFGLGALVLFVRRIGSTR